MQLTKETLDREVAGLEAQLAELNRRVAWVSGAIEATKQLRAILDTPEPAQQEQPCPPETH